MQLKSSYPNLTPVRVSQLQSPWAQLGTHSNFRLMAPPIAKCSVRRLVREAALCAIGAFAEAAGREPAFVGMTLNFVPVVDLDLTLDVDAADSVAQVAAAGAVP